MSRIEPVTARGIQTKGRIVVAANTVYARHGRDRFTTELVAEEADVAIGTIYRYFEDRVDLMDECAPNRDREALDKFIGRLKDVERTYPDMERDLWVRASDVDDLIEEFAHGE